jgi:hypothetical protein
VQKCRDLQIVWACGIPTFFRLKRLHWAGHVVKTDDSTKSNGCFGERKSVGKPRNRWKDAVWMEALKLLQIRNWKAAAGKLEGWWKVIGEAMARQRGEATLKKAEG